MSAATRAYRPSELRALQSSLDDRWPLMADDDALYWLRRYADNRSPYSRVRRHVIRAQLDAIIALALQLGLRRSEIYALTEIDAHYDNEYVVVGDWRTDHVRCVPFTRGARDVMHRWLDARHFLGPDSRALWLNTHAASTADVAMSADTFNRRLGTYCGDGWELRRLRDTCAAAWVRAGMPLEHLRQLLGLARIEETLPYARLVRGSLAGQMDRLDDVFTGLITACASAPGA
jgi:site-specific recombinase XerD